MRHTGLATRTDARERPGGDGAAGGRRKIGAEQVLLQMAAAPPLQSMWKGLTAAWRPRSYRSAYTSHGIAGCRWDSGAPRRWSAWAR